MNFRIFVSVLLLALGSSIQIFSAKPTTKYDLQFLVAGGTGPGFADGALFEAAFLAPEGIAYVESDDSVVVVDGGNHSLRRVRLDNAVTTTLAGNGRAGEMSAASASSLSGPTQVMVPKSGAYIAVLNNGGTQIRVFGGANPVQTLRLPERVVRSAWDSQTETLYWSGAAMDTLQMTKIPQGGVKKLGKLDDKLAASSLWVAGRSGIMTYTSITGEVNWIGAGKVPWSTTLAAKTSHFNAISIAAGGELPNGDAALYVREADGPDWLVVGIRGTF